MVSKEKNKKNAKSIEQHHEGEEEFDERFIAAVNRPQFQKHKEEKAKVVLDDRFASVLTDPKFSLQTKDKYGRRKKKKVQAGQELKEFYTVEKKSEDPEQDDEGTEGEAAGPVDDDDEKEDSASEEGEEDKDPASRIAYLTALSRGELDVSESSDDDIDSESDDDDSDLDEPVYGKAGVLDPSNNEEDDLSLTEVPSPYMAVMNMDWTHVRAVDLFAMLSSFTPPGSIRKVQVYPSDYGLERMEKERQYGPTDLWKKKKGKQVDEQDDDEEEGDDEDEVDSEGDEPREPEIKFELEDDHVDSSFDPEKLRSYEASKLKYYFAVVEFASPEHADSAYKEVDGLELEHSSASVDMRSIDPDQLEGVVQDRKLRDEASALPSNYEPPEFVVSALQQTSVTCTWDEGDVEREQRLTKYSSGQGWNEQADSEDLRAYLASDHSSDDDSDAESDEEEGGKGSNMRKMLGLDSDDDDENGDSKDDDGSDDDQGFGDEDGEKQVSFIPGTDKESLEEKIRSKLEGTKEEKELTPWEKYQEKRKAKRREKRQSTRSRRKGGAEEESDEESDEVESDEGGFGEDDDFFVEEREARKKESKLTEKKKKKKSKSTADDENGGRAPSTKEELSLLVAGEEDDEDARDYDMRGLVRMDKLKGKKLTGARKRKQDKLASNVSGGDFKINTKDSRFAAVFQGDNGQFGIDRTDPNYKETEAMRDILSEQTKQRKARKRAKKNPVAPNVNAEAGAKNSGGASALSSLVKSLKSKVAKTSKS
jgi:hypothetical protein